MFVFDILKEEGGRVRAIGAMVALGMFVLLGGLWFVQIVCARQFESDLKRQSFRQVRTPAIRGRILDRNGQVLADEKPRYNAVLYLEDLQPQFANQYARLKTNYARMHPEVVNSKGKISLATNVKQRLQWEADCEVVSNYTYRISDSLKEPRLLNTNAFMKHYREHPYVPFQILADLQPEKVAILSEQWLGQPAIDLETQPVRDYGKSPTAANLIGYVLRRDSSEGGKYSFDMPDYQGTSGVEYVYDDLLRGQPGDNSVLINNMNYRQRTDIETPNLPGKDIYLTIDLAIQRAAEKALAKAPAAASPVRGAVVVMDPRNGDILALASAPSFDPNLFARDHRTIEESKYLNDPKYKPQFNRAVGGAYPPGSTFKIITAIACLENGLDSNEVYNSEGRYQPNPNARAIGDTAGPGPFNLERAIYRSSNTYFIVMGLRTGLRKLFAVAKRFHLGEKTDLHQEVAGDIPGPENVGPNLGMSEPDIYIGQEITTTPLQVAGMISVIANGGALYWPRVVSHSVSQSGESEEIAAKGRVRDHVQINPNHLALIRHAMLEDTEHRNDGMGAGTAYAAFHQHGPPDLGNFRVAAKTGTAEVKSPGSAFHRVTWFASYGPYEDPRYVVIVMVEDGNFGGTTCAPVAKEIYQAIIKEEQSGQARPKTLAGN